MITATATLGGTISATASLMAIQTGDCADATVENSDASFSEQIPSGDTAILEDTIINVYVNGVLNQSITRPSMVDRTINIS